MATEEPYIGTFDHSGWKRQEKFKWKRIHQEYFEAMKKIVSNDVLLAYLGFTIPFKIHADASDR
eukprot:14297785-Ditylum_brightwellii.AAC.1